MLPPLGFIISILNVLFPLIQLEQRLKRSNLAEVHVAQLRYPRRVRRRGEEVELRLRGWWGHVRAVDVLGVDLVFFEAGEDFLGARYDLRPASRPFARR